MIYVCWADVSVLDESAESILLSEYRKEKLQAIKQPAGKRCSLGVELLLLSALKKYAPELSLPPHILTHKGGKPYLADSRWHFNLSHTGAFAACALSENEIGLDIQRLVSPRSALVERVLTAEEREYLESAVDCDEAFSELWCRKESFLKATGRGLSAGLQSFCVAPGAERLQDHGISYHIYHQHFQGFQLALCYPETDEPDITIEKIDLP